VVRSRCRRSLGEARPVAGIDQHRPCGVRAAVGSVVQKVAGENGPTRSSSTRNRTPLARYGRAAPPLRNATDAINGPRRSAIATSSKKPTWTETAHRQRRLPLSNSQAIGLVPRVPKVEASVLCQVRRGTSASNVSVEEAARPRCARDQRTHLTAIMSPPPQQPQGWQPPGGVGGGGAR